jgi:hypothetical protein
MVGAPLLAAVGILLGGLVLALFSGSTRIGLTVKLSDWSLAWFFVPPLVLVGARLWSRRDSDDDKTARVSPKT